MVDISVDSRKRTGPPQLAGESRLSRAARSGRNWNSPGPAGMGEVAGPDDRYALPPGPPGERRNIAVPAASAGEPGVDVQVGVEHPGWLALSLSAAYASAGRPAGPASWPCSEPPGTVAAVRRRCLGSCHEALTLRVFLAAPAGRPGAGPIACGRARARAVVWVAGCRRAGAVPCGW